MPMTNQTQRRGGVRGAPDEQPTARPGAALARIEDLKPQTLARFEAEGYPIQKLAVIQQQIARDATLYELVYFLERCIATGLDPARGQIFFVKRKDSNSPTGTSVSFQTGIDGFRAIADKTQQYAGSDEPEYEGQTEDGHPALARVTVWKIVAGQRVPFVGVARWTEFYPGDRQGFMWLKMPFLMLGKCAEAQALRKAFPVALGDVAVAGELGAADGMAQYVDAVADRAAGRIDDGPKYLERVNTTTGEITTVRAGDEYVRVMQEQGEDVQTDDRPEERPLPSDAKEEHPAQVETAPTVNSSGVEMPPGYIEARQVEGLCLHPECCEHNTSNKAAPDTDPPRCLNHVG